MNPQPLAKAISLKNKVAIVTGGAMGIGFGIAYRLAEAGAKVVITDINIDYANKAVADLKKKGWRAMAVTADVSKASDVSKMISQTVAKFNSVDILVNNAGIYPNRLVMDMEEEVFEKVIDVNLKGVFLCSQAAAKQMIKQKRGGSPRENSGVAGKIINITSVDSVHPSMPGLAHYDASKHGVWGFTKNMALELAKHNIFINTVAPGGILTPGVSGSHDANQKVPAALKAFERKVPMGRFGQPDDIGKAVLFLASDLSSYMTGSQVVVDGGLLLA